MLKSHNHDLFPKYRKHTTDLGRVQDTILFLSPSAELKTPDLF